MATLLKCGGLFLHVPKTGGNWVSAVLEANALVFAHVGGKHAGPPQLAPLTRLLDTPTRYARANRSLFTFCFVRHPLRWYESWFKMNSALGWPQWAADEDAWNPSVELNGLGAPTFGGFIENVLANRHGFLAELFEFYARDAHFVGRQETLREDLLQALAFLRVGIGEPRVRSHQPVNVSDREPLRLEPSLRADLESAEREAYRRYAYAPAEADAEVLADYEPFTARRLRHASDSPAPETGFAWYLAAPTLTQLADNDEHGHRSLLTVLENGTPLAAPHTPHADIRRLGRGRFSHWKQGVLFSTSDNSDPRTNGRRYELAWRFDGPAHETTLMIPPPESNP